jgi:hypothetical protein
LAITLVAVVLLTVVSGCGTGEQRPVEVTQEATQVVQATPAPLPADESQRIVMFRPDGPHCNPDDYGKLEELAFASGMDLDITGGTEEFLAALASEDVTAAIYAPDQPTAEALFELEAFVSRGGHALFVYDEEWAEQNDPLQQLFEVSVERETVATIVDGLPFFNQAMLPSYMKGQHVVIYRTCVPFELPAYLVTSLEVGEKQFLRSEDTGQDRLMYFDHPTLSAKFWPAVTMFSDPCMPFFDEDLSLGDNPKAALGLLSSLVE